MDGSEYEFPAPDQGKTVRKTESEHETFRLSCFKMQAALNLGLSPGHYFFRLSRSTSSSLRSRVRMLWEIWDKA